MVDDAMIHAALTTANEALRVATIVQTQQQGHENACGRRYEDWRAQSGRTEKSLEDVHTRINDNVTLLSTKIDTKIGSVYKILWGTSATTILLLLTALASILFYMLTGHK